MRGIDRCPFLTCEPCSNVPTRSPQPGTMEPYRQHIEENIMGKYLIAWLLGVPAVVLVLIYLIF